jgi:hypothetical protein
MQVYTQNFESQSNGATIPNWSNQGTAAYKASTTNVPTGSVAGRDANASNGDTVIVTAGYTAIADMELSYDVTLETASNGGPCAAGAILRSDSTGANGYYLLFGGASTGAQLQILGFRFNGGVPTALMPNIFIPGVTFSSGQTLSCRFRVQGSTISAKVWAYGGTEPSGFAGTFTDSSVTAAGRFGFYQGNGSAGATGGSSIDNISLDNLVSPSVAGNIATIYTSSTSQNEVIWTGTGSSWTSSTTFSISGGSGASIASSTNVSATTQVFKIISGTAAGTLTITGSDGSTGTITVATGSTVQPNSSLIQLKGPVNITSQEAITITTGQGGIAYYNGTAILRFNVEPPMTVYADVIYQTDRDAPVRTSLSVANPTITLAPYYPKGGVGAYQHVVRWWYAIYEGAGDPSEGSINKWSSLQTAARFAGLDLVGSASALSLPPLNPNVLFTVGDSLTEGVRTLYSGSASNQTCELPQADWSLQLADRLGLDYTQLGYGGTGVTVSGSGGVPACPSSLGYCYNGVSWTAPVAPYITIVYHGTNDSSASSSAFQSAYVSTLNRIRALWPNTIIWAVNPHPCDGTHSTNRVSDIASAVATSGLSNIHTADATTAGLSTSNDWADTIGHLNPGGHTKLAVWFENLIQTAFNSSGIVMGQIGATVAYGF